MKSSISKFDDNRYMMKTRDFDKNIIVYLDTNMNLFVSFTNENINDYKIASNVINYFIINVGQNDYKMLYFINYDGTVGKVNINDVTSTDSIKVESDLGYKNIVSIVNGNFYADESGSVGPLFIDIDGNIYE